MSVNRQAARRSHHDPRILSVFSRSPGTTALSTGARSRREDETLQHFWLQYLE